MGLQKPASQVGTVPNIEDHLPFFLWGGIVCAKINFLKVQDELYAFIFVFFHSCTFSLCLLPQSWTYRVQLMDTKQSSEFKLWHKQAGLRIDLQHAWHLNLRITGLLLKNLNKVTIMGIYSR